LLTLGVSAQESADVLTVKFRSDPPVVSVYDVDQQFLGTTTGPLSLSGRYFQDQTAVSLFFAAPHFKAREELIRRQDLSGGTFPPADRPPIRLEEAYPGARAGLWVRSHLALVGVLGAAGFWVAHWLLTWAMSLFRRQRRLRELETKADGSDSLVLTELGGYFLTEVLGSGGMATVYRAVPRACLDESEAVAVKVLNRDSWRDTGFQERFRREVETYRKLHHRHVVQMIGWGEYSNGLTFLVMELIRGRTLADLIPRDGFPPPRAVELLGPVLEGVDWAHQRGIVHRDLKPENIMVSDAGLVKVMDFGLARNWDLKTITQAGTVMGTPAYMAPEQVQGMPCDHRADQYALGVVAFEMVTGHRPFEHREPMALMLAHVSSPVPPPGGPLEPVILRMLSKEPEARYPDLLAARDALEAALR